MKPDNPAQQELRRHLATKLSEARSAETEAKGQVNAARQALEAAQIREKQAKEALAFLEEEVARNTPKDTHAHKAPAHAHAAAKSA